MTPRNSVFDQTGLTPRPELANDNIEESLNRFSENDDTFSPMFNFSLSSPNSTMRTHLNCDSHTANSLLLDGLHVIKSPCSTLGGLNVLADGAIYSAKKCHSPSSNSLIIPTNGGSSIVRSRSDQDEFSSRLIDSNANDRFMDLTSAIKTKRRNFMHNNSIFIDTNQANINSFIRNKSFSTVHDKILRSEYENDSAPFNESTVKKKSRVCDESANIFSPHHDLILNNLSLR